MQSKGPNKRIGTIGTDSDRDFRESMKSSRTLIIMNCFFSDFGLEAACFFYLSTECALKNRSRFGVIQIIHHYLSNKFKWKTRNGLMPALLCHKNTFWFCSCARNSLPVKEVVSFTGSLSYFVHNRLALLHKYTSTRVSDGVHQSA